jgi:hypothetical protein
VTPNRVTFGRPDEVIDRFHYLEYDDKQLRAWVHSCFAEVQIYGLFGSALVSKVVEHQREVMERVLRLHALRLRRSVPRVARQRLYSLALTTKRRRAGSLAADVDQSDFPLASTDLRQALDLVGVCRTPLAGTDPVPMAERHRPGR